MADIKPFRGLRAPEEIVADFSTTAYDPELRLQTAEKSGIITYLHIHNPRWFYEEDLSQEKVFKISRKNLEKVVMDGLLIREEKPAFYLYRQIRKGNSFTGFIALASAKEYANDKIKKHELTRTEKEKKIYDHFNNVGINGSPVLLTYEHKPAISELITKLVEPKPKYHFISEDEVEHMLWVITDENDLKEISRQFSLIDDVYIGDGHHRCAAAHHLLGEEGLIMSCLIDSAQIKIRPFHRLLKNLNGVSGEKFVKKLRGEFEVTQHEKMPDPAPGLIVMYLEDAWYSIKLGNKGSNLKENLDVSILDKHIFGDMLDITDSRTSSAINYISGDEDTKQVIAPVMKGEMAAAFLLYPLSVRDVFEISDAGETLPPKSTWIEPKLRSGLLIHKF